MDGLMEFQDFVALISKVQTQRSLFMLGALLAKQPVPKEVSEYRRCERKRDASHQPPPPSSSLPLCILNATSSHAKVN